MYQFELLREVGLSKTATTCYKSLLEQGPATAGQLAGRVELPVTNLYGVLKSLVEKGFVTKFKLTTRPALFTARPLDRALPEHYMHQRQVLLPLCHELGILPPALPPKLRRPR